MKRKKLLIVVALVSCILLCAGILAGCNSLKLDAPADVKYNGALLTWKAVENATKYEVQIGESEAKTITTNSLAYDAQGKEFSVTITAVSDNDKVVKSASSTMTFKPLSKISELNVANDGTVSWATVELATGYIVKVNGTEITGDLTATSYSALPVGTSTVEVKPTVSGDNSYYASWSPSKSVTKLATPITITYDGEMISWYAVTGAVGYEVYANSTLLEDVSGTKVAYNAQNTNFSVTVKALGNHVTSYDSAVSAAKDFVFLRNVSAITVEEGVIKWEEINGASGYKIKLNNNVQGTPLSSNVYDKLPTGTAYEVSVMPISNDATYFSSWSAPKSITILPAPVLDWDTALALDGDANNNLFWNYSGVTGGFNVKLAYNGGDPSIVPYPSTQRSYGHAYLDEGTYKVSVQAIAAGENVFSSAYSKEVTVVRLSAPTALSNGFITSDPSDVTEGFKINYNVVSGATEYKLFKEGGADTGVSSQNGTLPVDGVIDVNITEEQTLNFYVRSMGSFKTVDNGLRATLSSLTATALNVQIKVLAMPKNVTIGGSTMSWDAVGSGSNYVVDYENGAASVAVNSYDLTNNLAEPGSYDVKVCTKGDGAAVLPSNYSAKIEVVRLAAPTNIKLLTQDAQEGVLSWTEVTNSKSYQAFINNSNTPITVNSESNLLDQITTQGTTIHMRAVGDYFKDASNQIYYMTSPNSDTVFIKKLQTIDYSSVVFTNTEVQWAAPSNVTSDYAPTYRIYKAAKNLYPGGELNATKMNIAEFEAGEYNFIIKAIGNGTTFINSDNSQVATITKLASPEVSIQNNAYAWSGVAGASGYSVWIDGQKANNELHVSGTSYSFTPTFDSIGSHEVKVYAVGDNGATTIDSKPYTFNQTVVRLATPGFTFSYTKEAYDATNGEIKVDVTVESENALGYYYIIGGTISAATTDLTHNKNPQSVGIIPVTVKAQGGKIVGTTPATSTYYIDSSTESGRNVIILGKPNDDSRIDEGRLIWNKVNDENVFGYEISLSVDGGTAEILSVTGNVSSLDISDKLVNVASITVKVRAKGNGTTVITSAWSTEEIIPIAR